MLDQFDIFSGLTVAPKAEQFKLVQFQVFNWGTFNDLVTVDIAERGFLFVGPSGAGKSTLLDAHATLLTPPKWVGFNVAAREGEAGGHGADRNLMSYVRGAWAQETGKSGEVAQKHLREGTTWSALAETYRSDRRTVTIAQVFWVRGKTTDRKEVKRTYLVVDRAFDVKELQPFADKDFDLKLVRALPGVHVHDEFSGYGERFRRYMGIEQESALRLLHKTQSAKNLGDLNDFLRDFTLEPPQTFGIAQQLVEHFQSLREAHATVVDTRRQIEVLAPARAAYTELLTHRATLAQLTQTRGDLDAYREQLKAQLLQGLIERLQVQVLTNEEAAQQWREQEEAAKATLELLVGKRDGNAVAQVALCEAELREADRQLRTVEGNQAAVARVCELLDIAAPGSDDALREVVHRAGLHLADVQRVEQANQTQRDELGVDLRASRKAQAVVQTELAALAKRRSNIPSQLLDMRSSICDELGFEEADFPFAGELVDVHADHREWKGAAERMMRDFAGHMLVSDANFSMVSRYVNQTHMRALVKLYHVVPVTESLTAKPGTLASKLSYADHPSAEWLANKAAKLFDHECVDSALDLERHRRAVTREGLSKANDSSFRKDDRYRIDDHSQWMLGGDTRAKVASLQDELERLDAGITALEQRIKALQPPSGHQAQLRQVEEFMTLSWEQVDLVTARAARDHAQSKLNLAREEAPDTTLLEAQIAEQAGTHGKAQKEASRLEATNAALEGNIQSNTERLAKLHPELLTHELSEDVKTELQARFSVLASAVELDNLDQVASQAKDAITQEERAAQAKASSRLHDMTSQFREYMRAWPEKAANLDATEASAEEFFTLLAQLETDGLPHYEAKFLELLQEQGTQEMMRLHLQLDSERKDIRTRMEAVNASLKQTAFNKGTYLVIEPREKSLPEVMAFRQNLKEAYGNYLADQTTEDIERRFGILNTIAKRLESLDEVDKAWRALCLDVRRHVEFVIREFNTEGVEVDVYRSGAGKSGGQRQKLTAAILAAALRYQLGGKESGLPKFATVFMDEAFDKADAEFTDLAMKVFETFGFQLVVATPLKSVMTLEPYIGGACFVHIEKSKHSHVLPVAYLEDSKKLDFTTAGVSVEADVDI